MSENNGIISGLLGIVQENFTLISAGAIGVYAAHTYGYIDAPAVEIPTGSGVIITGAVAVAIAGYVMAGKIDALLPDPEGIFIVCFESSDEEGGEVWELSEDQFSDMEVVNGSLFQWPHASRRIYEVRSYDSERNVAVANWRESVAGSQLAGDASVVEAFASIEELRTEFEPEARKYRHLQRRIRGIVRKLDERRLHDQQAILDEHLTPDFGDDNATVSGVLKEELPDELLPESMTGEKADEIADATARRNGHNDGELVGFDLLEDGEALEPTENDNT